MRSPASLATPGSTRSGRRASRASYDLSASSGCSTSSRPRSTPRILHSEVSPSRPRTTRARCSTWPSTRRTSTASRPSTPSTSCELYQTSTSARARSPSWAARPTSPSSGATSRSSTRARATCAPARRRRGSISYGARSSRISRSSSPTRSSASMTSGSRGSPTPTPRRSSTTSGASTARSSRSRRGASKPIYNKRRRLGAGCSTGSRTGGDRTRSRPAPSWRPKARPAAAGDDRPRASRTVCSAGSAASAATWRATARIAHTVLNIHLAAVCNEEDEGLVAVAAAVVAVEVAGAADTTGPRTSGATSSGSTYVVVDRIPMLGVGSVIGTGIALKIVEPQWQIYLGSNELGSSRTRSSSTATRRIKAAPPPNNNSRG
mmetsp:Transcript_8534/g.35144  ORF Transcript_8534/g.35144 Transcript_8534/m.35144 type:complete len:377 (-) Transcript_8534:47-1177(-)